MRSGLHIWATSSTQRPNRSCLGFSAAVSTSIVVVAIMMNISPVDRCADHGRVAEYGRVIHGGFSPYQIFFDSRHNTPILSQLRTLFQRTAIGDGPARAFQIPVVWYCRTASAR